MASLSNRNVYDICPYQPLVSVYFTGQGVTSVVSLVFYAASLQANYPKPEFRKRTASEGSSSNVSRGAGKSDANVRAYTQVQTPNHKLVIVLVQKGV